MSDAITFLYPFQSFFLGHFSRVIGRLDPFLTLFAEPNVGPVGRARDPDFAVASFNM
jgi:hypothetical protein